MRKLTREPILAEQYMVWHNALVDDEHPEYNSSKSEFYYDIVANLFWIQKGLCAYTEKFLADVSLVAPDRWENGKLISKEIDFFGQLDHFDASLKVKNGWKWTNFFMAQSDINRKKGTKNVKLLKPDNDDYDPFKYLNYNAAKSLFYPNNDLTDAEVEFILDDIHLLGLNHSSIVAMRRNELNPIVEQVKYGAITSEEGLKKLNQFYTAYEITIRNLLDPI